MPVECRPVTVDRADDLARFAQGGRGSFAWCWCMRWRLPSSEFRESTKETRANGLLDRARRGEPIGILAYSGGEPIGWCSIAPRCSFGALERSRTLARIDEQPVWSVTCLAVDRGFRRKGVTELLVRAAAEYAFANGAPAVECYPVPSSSAGYRYMGTVGTFRRAGFVDATPAGRTRLVMRLTSPR